MTTKIAPVTAADFLAANERRREFLRLTGRDAELEAEEARDLAQRILDAGAASRAVPAKDTDHPVDAHGVPLAKDSLGYKIVMAARKAKGLA